MSPMAEKLLTLIGLPPVTNREAIMQEIEALSDEEFDRFIGGHTKLDVYVDGVVCEKCKEAHGGCIRTDDSESCSRAFNRIDWLRKTNTEDLNIREVLT